MPPTGPVPGITVPPSTSAFARVSLLLLLLVQPLAHATTIAPNMA
jgi:hypothetical protein